MEAQSFIERQTLEAIIARGDSVAAAVIRRAVDLFLASLLLVLLAPVLLAIMIAIRIDSPGPAFYRQRRVGRDMLPFTVNKFRTMRTDADETRHRDYVYTLISTSAAKARTGGKNLYKLAVDDRITGVGRFLRRSSLDELPQLWNVLRGEMSLVGPRPVIPYEVEQYPTWYRERFTVKPGLTGLWQVSGRNERTYEEMVLLDIKYARTRGLGLDLLILLKTARVVLLARGAA